MKIASPAAAYWDQRLFLRDKRTQILRLHRAVDAPGDLSSHQWAQLMAFLLDFGPTLILELGRRYGNSTCALTEVANALAPGPCQVVSLCITDSWKRDTLPKVREIVADPDSWLSPLQAIQADIVTFDYQRVLTGCERVAVFWDAHGYAVAECVLGRILPLIADRPHVVIMHDLSDARYVSPAQTQYGERRLWTGGNSSETRVRLGHIDSAVEQAVAVVDFASRNGLPLHSADESLRTELGQDRPRARELQATIGDELFSVEAHWFWFSLNEIPGPYTFPRFTAVNGAPLTEEEATRALSFAARYPLLFAYLAANPALAEELERGRRELDGLRWMPNWRPAKLLWFALQVVPRWIRRRS